MHSWLSTTSMQLSFSSSFGFELFWMSLTYLFFFNLPQEPLELYWKPGWLLRLSTKNFTPSKIVRLVLSFTQCQPEGTLQKTVLVALSEASSKRPSPNRTILDAQSVVAAGSWDTARLVRRKHNDSTWFTEGKLEFIERKNLYRLILLALQLFF